MTAISTARSTSVPAGPSKRLTAKDRLATIGVGLLLGGAAFFWADAAAVDAAPTAAPDYMASTVADIAYHPNQASTLELNSDDSELISLDESESSNGLDSDISLAEPTDWFSALAAYGRNWACTITSSSGPFRIAHEEYTIIGITLAEMEALLIQRNRIMRDMVSDESVICHNSEDEIIELEVSQ